MAGPAFKVQFFFNLANFGWTEDLYYIGPSGTSIGVVLTDAKALAVVRRAFLAADVDLAAVRVSDLGAGTSPRQMTTNVTDVAFGTDIGGANVGGGDTSIPANLAVGPWEAILCRLDTLDRIGRRPMLLRGVPVAYWGWDSFEAVAPPFPAAVLTAIDVYRRQLNNQNSGNTPWSIRVRVRDEIANPSVPISIVLFDDELDCIRFALILDGDRTADFAAGDRVHVYGFKAPGVKGLNTDSYLVSVKYDPSSNSTKLLLSSRPKCCIGVVPIPITLGRVQKVLYGYKPIRYLTIERYVKRDTGRAFFGTAGRRGGAGCR